MRSVAALTVRYDYHCSFSLRYYRGLTFAQRVYWWGDQFLKFYIPGW